MRLRRRSRPTSRRVTKRYVACLVLLIAQSLRTFWLRTCLALSLHNTITLAFYHYINYHGKSVFISTYLDPHLLVLLQCGDDIRHVRLVDAVLAEDGINLRFFCLGHVDDFFTLPCFFDFVVLGFGFGSEPSVETHADGACKELGCAADDD
jgi:hypothetical protein